MKKHFVLIHGLCHGAWYWYKLKPMLEAEGHRVTALDLSASGINTKKIEEIQTMAEYSEPLTDLMKSIPPEEKVILVGHSLGGLTLGVAMEEFPHKISTAIFVTAFMPDFSHPPSYVLDQLFEKIPAEAWLDTQFSSSDNSGKPAPSVLIGPKDLSRFYHLCSPQDFSLGMMLMRRGSVFLEDLSKAKAFSKERYGSVKRIYIVIKEDQIITEKFQRWMIENNPVQQVKEIDGADHMAMFSNPEDLCRCLLEIANDASP